MTFAENINRICAEKGTNLTAIVKAVKGSSSFATAINTKGSSPKESEMLEMAKLLECSVMDFFADEEDLPETKPANEDEEDILRIYRGLSRRAKHEFMSMAYEFENREELEGIREQLRQCDKVIPFALIYRKKILEVRLSKR